MKILLAPSETKKSGGDSTLTFENMLFEELTLQRTELLNLYNLIVQKGDLGTLSKMFGIKKKKDIFQYQKDIVNSPTMKAIERYTGVAFDYLEYDGMNKTEKKYIDQNVILFSNLFGPILASDLIPEYKLKQGEQVGDIKTEKYYNQHSAHLVEEYLEDEEILDLRAGFYDKFYKPTKPYTTLKFIKDGKVVSHWAKAYRGIVLREIAKNNVKTLKEFMNLHIEGLYMEKSTTTKNKTEIIYNITKNS